MRQSEIQRLWSQGIIAAWYLRDSQLEIYDLLVREKDPFVEAARRFGKTTSILCYVLEQLIQNPGHIARWCEPWKEQAREIVMPEIEKIQASAGYPHPRFTFRSTGSVYVGTNGSRLPLRGVNEDRGESARGSFAHIVIADEFGSWKDPEYTVNEVLRPQLLTTNGQFVFASTPPDDLDHAYYVHKERAIRQGRFIQKIIYQNESLTPEKIKEEMDAVGGEHTPAWRREYLCEEVSDPEKKVIPEYDSSLHDVEDDYPRPEYCDRYVGIDLGFHDNSAFLFGYWDFKKRELVIEDEVALAGRNSKELVEHAKAAELTLWGTKPCSCQRAPDTLECTLHGWQPYMRVGDNELQQLHDMATLHGYSVAPTRKDDKLAAINALRLRFGQGGIKIKKRCKSLRYQLKVGLWNDRKTDFKRGDKIGHLDAVDALIYLHRNLVEHRNPYPANPGATLHTHHLPETSSQGPQERALIEAFSVHV
jgi:hypothetical protein